MKKEALVRAVATVIATCCNLQSSVRTSRSAETQGCQVSWWTYQSSWLPLSDVVVLCCITPRYLWLGHTLRPESARASVPFVGSRRTRTLQQLSSIRPRSLKNGGWLTCGDGVWEPKAARRWGPGKVGIGEAVSASCVDGARTRDWRRRVGSDVRPGSDGDAGYSYGWRARGRTPAPLAQRQEPLCPQRHPWCCPGLWALRESTVRTCREQSWKLWFEDERIAQRDEDERRWKCPVVESLLDLWKY